MESDVIGESSSSRDMNSDNNFKYNSEGNLIEDKFLQGESSEKYICVFSLPNRSELRSAQVQIPENFL